MQPEVVETVVTGMTKGELAAVICIVVVTIAAAIAILSYIMSLHLKPLQKVPDQLSQLNGKVKSGSELNLMIENKIQEHELNCPNRNKKE
jgi:cell division protein FtsL